MIRTATEEELPKVARLWLKMVQELKSEWVPNTEKWLESRVLLLASQMYYIVVADINGEFVGFLDGMAYADPERNQTVGLAVNFYLKSEYRHQGLMPLMYADMLKIAKEKGVDVIECQCHPDMLGYWEDFGFKQEKYVLRMVI